MTTIKNWFLTGDCHGGSNVVTRIKNILRNNKNCMGAETGIIILGDAGINFWLNKTDAKYKKEISSIGCKVYCVRGNHEERPENLGYSLEFDPDVSGNVYVEEKYPNIRYFVDGGDYIIDIYSVLVIGGAYSVDKWYRLKRAAIAGESFSGWFKDEQLTEEEMKSISEAIEGEYYDFVFTHTCPLEWEPVDLFLGSIDQSTVDRTMERWMNKLKESFNWNIWCFGHFHSDRIERPRVEQFYREYEKLDTIWNRWNGDKTYKKEWWLSKSPYMKEWDKLNE